MKSADLYATKATFRISRKGKDDNSDEIQKKYPKSLGSIFGGGLSLVSQCLFIYLIINGFNKTFSGAKDNISNRTLTNTYQAPFD